MNSKKNREKSSYFVLFSMLMIGQKMKYEYKEKNCKDYSLKKLVNRQKTLEFKS